MRDPARIDETLDVIRRIWKSSPDLRLMQLLLNVNATYNTEEDDLLVQLEDLYDPPLILEERTYSYRWVQWCQDEEMGEWVTVGIVFAGRGEEVRTYLERETGRFSAMYSVGEFDRMLENVGREIDKPSDIENLKVYNNLKYSDIKFGLTLNTENKFEELKKKLLFTLLPWSAYRTHGAITNIMVFDEDH